MTGFNSFPSACKLRVSYILESFGQILLTQKALINLKYRPLGPGEYLDFYIVYPSDLDLELAEFLDLAEQYNTYLSGNEKLKSKMVKVSLSLC